MSKGDETSGIDAALLVNQLLNNAFRMRASDIHLKPQEDGAEIWLRLDGRLKIWRTISPEQLKAMATRIKFIANMDIGETRLPQDGALHHLFAEDQYQLRIATIPSIYGEKMVIRLFPHRDQHLSLSHLGFTPRQLQEIVRLIQLPHGLLLITGPTGSGKTTTMYKLLEVLAKDSDRNICSLEDPVEMRLPMLTQVQVNPRAGLTFAAGLRALLRQDPDVIFVGEIRDEETAEIAVRAALTGHLVLSTLHTFDAVGAITRLLEMGIKPYYLASALVAVVAQRLIRLRCLLCDNKGCYACFFTGFKGRTGVFELLSIGGKLKEAVQMRRPEKEIRQIVRRLNIASIGAQLLRYQAIGLTTEQESFRYLLADRYFQNEEAIDH